MRILSLDMSLIKASLLALTQKSLGRLVPWLVCFLQRPSRCLRVLQDLWENMSIF